MHEPPENIRRRVIPRWRNLHSTPKDELTFPSELSAPTALQEEFDTLLLQWRRAPNLNNANELLYAATLGFTIPEIYQAAQFVIKSPLASLGTKKLAAVHLSVFRGGVDDLLPPQVKSAKTSFQIQTLKKRVNAYPRNPLTHVDIARAYVSGGQIEKAKNHIRIAIHLAPTSRFVLRSVARFDVHRGDLERSLQALADTAAYDPWVAAAYVSVADLANKSPKRIKPIRLLLESITDPAQVTELAAALGTLELKSTGIRKARKYFQMSSIAPNENVVAQLYWLSKNYGVGFDQRLLKNSLAHEAHAQSAAVAKSWSAAIESCWRWLDDEPFSVRPAYEGGFIASEIMQDFKTAQEFAHRGLLSNPKTAGLLNNLAYALIMDSNLHDGAENLRRAKQLVEVDQRQQLIVQATEGLLSYRTGNSGGGARQYMAAILRAYKLKADSLMHIAYLHFCYEELRIGHSPPFLTPEQLENVFTKGNISKVTKTVFERLVLPMLHAHRSYGLLDVGYTPDAPLFEKALLPNRSVSDLTDEPRDNDHSLLDHVRKSRSQ
jgi:hypothetical protein